MIILNNCNGVKIYNNGTFVIFGFGDFVTRENPYGQINKTDVLFLCGNLMGGSTSQKSGDDNIINFSYKNNLKERLYNAFQNLVEYNKLEEPKEKF